MTTPLTRSVVPAAPTILNDPRAILLRCTRRYDCPAPGCGKVLLTVRSDADAPPAGLTLVRECPRQKSLLCEFRLDEALPTNGRR